jgi:hypothetical protein
MTCPVKRAMFTITRLVMSLALAAASVLLLAACRGKSRAVVMRTPSPVAPAAVSAVVPDAGTSAPPEVAVDGPIWRFVVAWNTALDHHDTNALGALYAGRVSFYGRRSSRTEVIRAKQAAFAAEPDFHQRIPGYIDINLGVGDYYVARFYKLSGKSEPLSGTNAKLVVKRGDGGSWLILEEADDEASEKQNALCDTKAAEVVNALPAVQRKVAEASAQADTSNGKLHLGGISPQDLSAPDGFFASIDLQGDESSEPVLHYEVDREGHLKVLVGHEGPVSVPPAALRKVAQACRR